MEKHPEQFFSLSDIMGLEKINIFCSLNGDESIFGSKVLVLNIGVMYLSQFVLVSSDLSIPRDFFFKAFPTS